MISLRRNCTFEARQTGFLSLEAIIVLVVVLSLLALGASKMDILGSNADATEELSNVQTLYSSTKGLKTLSGYGAAGTDLVPSLVASKAIPKNMAVISDVIYNLFGGTVAVVSACSGNCFAISQNNIPADACVKLATKISKGGNFATTKINSNTAVSGEVTSATAASQCSGSGNTNSVSWTTNS